MSMSSYIAVQVPEITDVLYSAKEVQLSVVIYEWYEKRLLLEYSREYASTFV